MKILEDIDIEEGERFHYNDVYSSQQLAKFHDKHYFTTKKDDQALIGKGSHHHDKQQKFQNTLLLRSLLQGLGKRTKNLSTPKKDRCHNPKVLESEDMSQMLCKLLKLFAAPAVDMEPFDGNTLNYLYFMAIFKEVVESKIDNPRSRLTRLIKYITGNAKEFIKKIKLGDPKGSQNFIICCQSVEVYQKVRDGMHQMH